MISSADVLYAPVTTIRNGKTNWLCIGLTQAALCTVVAFFKKTLQFPNFHKWQWEPNGKPVKIKYEQKFPDVSRYYRGSPRNCIVQACCYRDDSEVIARDCLYNIFAGFTPVHYKKSCKSSATVTQRKRKKRSLAMAMGDTEKINWKVRVAPAPAKNLSC